MKEFLKDNPDLIFFIQSFTLTFQRMTINEGNIYSNINCELIVIRYSV